MCLDLEKEGKCEILPFSHEEVLQRSERADAGASRV